MTADIGPEKVTPDQAALNVYNIAAVCIGKISNAYKAGGEITESLKDRTNNAQCRLTGMSYKAQTYGAIYGGFKDVETQKIIDVIRNPDMSLKEKISNVSSHVGQNFSHECTVALGVKLAKGAILGALVAASAPGAVLAGAYIACKYGGQILQGGAEYFLSAPQGHHLETSLADKIKHANIFSKNFWRAHKGQDPEYAKMHDISEKMDHAVHGHAHDHGHHHNEKAHHTFKGDMKALAHAIKNPMETLRKIGHAIQEDVAQLNKHIQPAAEKVAGHLSRFAVKLDETVSLNGIKTMMEAVPLKVPTADAQEGTKMARIIKNNRPQA